MPTMTILPEGKTVDVAEGATLLEALLGAGAAILQEMQRKSRMRQLPYLCA